MKNYFLSDYQLIDSGDGEKLERFGEITVSRPAKFAIWRKNFPDKWKKLSAIFTPNKGWNRDLSWEIKCAEVKFRLRLQKNGQIGFFPEHLSYAERLVKEVNERAKPKLLNLFAYTGAFSVLAAKNSASVTHVEIAEPVISWAKENFSLNKIDTVRIIKEDALKFIRKEGTRGSKYDIIIADPPSFSRSSKSDSWSVEDIAPSMIANLKNILADDGVLIFTSHAYEVNDSVIANLISDNFEDKKIECSSLNIAEVNSERLLPSGFLVIAS